MIPPTPAVARAPGSLAEELEQSRPFDSIGQEVLVGLMRTADQARRFMDSVLSTEAVTVQQYNVLRILRGAGPEGLPTLEVGRRMIEQQPGITRLIDRLVSKELAERHRDPSDRRRMLCSLSPEGDALLDRVAIRLGEADRRFRRAMSEDTLESLSDHLTQARAALRSSRLDEDG